MKHTPEFWIGPSGACMPSQIYAVWQMTYPSQALGWRPVYTADQFDAAIRREPLVRVARG